MDCRSPATRLLLAISFACTGAAAQVVAGAVEVHAGAITVVWGLEHRDRAQRHADQLDLVLQQLVAALGGAPSPPPALRLFVFDDEEQARATALVSCHRELQGIGVLAAEDRAAVLLPPRTWREEPALQRLFVHVAVHLFVAQIVPVERQDELGYGWLAAGLAHRATTALPDGAADVFVVRDAVRSAQCYGGSFAAGAAALAQRESFPDLAALFATEARDFDFAQHVAAFTLVGWLQQAAVAPTTGAPRAAPLPSQLARIVEAARRGEPARQAVAAVAGCDLKTLDARVREFASRAVSATAAKVRGDAVLRRQHPHVALYFYASEPVLPRHRAVVDAALRRRHEAHTSGWRDDDGKPRLQLGAVNQRAGFWHGDDLVKAIDRAWPFVLVLEYAPDGEPRAYLECFRRAADHSGDDGWQIDPGVGFVEHHNAQFATASDERFAYLAVPDTPTGGHVGGSEFVHRARVTWADGSRAVLGVHTSFDAPKGKPIRAWHSTQTPLVDWRVLAVTPELGAIAVGGLDDPDRELAVWGSARLLPLPAIPPGLFAGRGRR